MFERRAKTIKKLNMDETQFIVTYRPPYTDNESVNSHQGFILSAGYKADKQLID